MKLPNKINNTGAVFGAGILATGFGFVLNSLCRLIDRSNKMKISHKDTTIEIEDEKTKRN